ncbi:MAG TPA: class I SAM-dependent methyltransferase, partial [Thermoleophilaceae bacterium]|nr:class I SAM-dependent methyltransferase [Thermoleophilaceae bacterium]
MPELVFRCPRCRTGTVATTDSECDSCGRRLPLSGGLPDFVADPQRVDERRFYDEEYAGESRPSSGTELADLAEHWAPDGNILRRLVYENLGGLRGKRVLLLGNGSSDRELHFLSEQPSAMVLSDLSIEAVRALSTRYDLGAAQERLTFAAIDAYDLPFPDDSIDLVYGDAFVHHLSPLDPFFAEVARVLAPGGRAVFVDDAYSPLWQRSKETWLKPVMDYTHRRNPISPEDMRFTMAGGFKEEDLAPRIRAVGGQPFFIRQSLIYYFWTRAADRLFPARLLFLGEARWVVRPMIALD